MTDNEPGQTGLEDQREKFRHRSPDTTRHQKERPEGSKGNPPTKPPKD